MAQLLPNVYQRFADLNNVPLAGGKLYSYNAGTNTPLATYSDQGASSPNTNPVVLDSGGGANVWITNVGYKLVLQDANGVTQWSVDNVYLIEPNAVGSGQLANGAVGTTQLADGAVTTGKVQTAAITTALLAAGAITTGTIAAGAVTFACLDPALDLSQLASSIEVVFRRSNDLSGARLQTVPQFPWTSPIQQANPLTLPTGNGNGCSWSADGRFFAVCHTASPFITIYERSAGIFNKLPDPATLPAGVGNDCAFSPNGDFLAVAHNTSPFITIYQRQGYNFTKLADPGTLPAAQGVRVRWSPNGEFLAVSSASDFQLYNVNGTTFTSIVGSSGITSPSGIAGEIAWSRDSQYIALSNRSGTGAFLSVWQRSVGITFIACTIATQPATVPGALHFTNSGAQLIGGYTSTPAYMFYYSISGLVFTFAGNPFPAGSPPAGPVFGISISPNGQLIAVVSNVSPYLQIYSGTIAGGFTLLSNPATIPVAACNAVAWGPTNQWLGLAVNGGPFMYTYLTASALPAKGLFWSRSFGDV